jgi:hypothetical protein
MSKTDFPAPFLDATPADVSAVDDDQAVIRRWRIFEERHEKGMLTSLAFLKPLLELGKDRITSERKEFMLERLRYWSDWLSTSEGGIRSPESIE